jgi:hypothetical protein
MQRISMTREVEGRREEGIVMKKALSEGKEQRPTRLRAELSGILRTKRELRSRPISMMRGNSS